jgi:hypothetical protein
MSRRASDLDRYLEQHRQQKMDMRFGIWNVRSLNRIGSLKTVVSKLAKYITQT